MRIGIDIGGSHIAAGIVDKNGKILSKETRDIDINYIKDENRAENLIVDIIENEINFLLQKNDFDISDISKIGIAVPGMPKEGKIRNLVNLNIEEFNIGKVLEEKYKTTIKIKNDGKCAGLAEKKYGALRIYDDCAFLCIGTGVGSAIFLGGELCHPIAHLTRLKFLISMMYMLLFARMFLYCQVKQPMIWDSTKVRYPSGKQTSRNKRAVKLQMIKRKRKASPYNRAMKH